MKIDLRDRPTVAPRRAVGRLQRAVANLLVAAAMMGGAFTAAPIQATAAPTTPAPTPAATTPAATTSATDPCAGKAEPELTACKLAQVPGQVVSGAGSALGSAAGGLVGGVVGGALNQVACSFTPWADGYRPNASAGQLFALGLSSNPTSTMSDAELWSKDPGAPTGSATLYDVFGGGNLQWSYTSYKSETDRQCYPTNVALNGAANAVFSVSQIITAFAIAFMQASADPSILVDLLSNLTTSGNGHVNALGALYTSVYLALAATVLVVGGIWVTVVGSTVRRRREALSGALWMLGALAFGSILMSPTSSGPLVYQAASQSLDVASELGGITATALAPSSSATADGSMVDRCKLSDGAKDRGRRLAYCQVYQALVVEPWVQGQFGTAVSPSAIAGMSVKGMGSDIALQQMRAQGYSMAEIRALQTKDGEVRASGPSEPTNTTITTTTGQFNAVRTAMVDADKEGATAGIWTDWSGQNPFMRMGIGFSSMVVALLAAVFCFGISGLAFVWGAILILTVLALPIVALVAIVPALQRFGKAWINQFVLAAFMLMMFQAAQALGLAIIAQVLRTPGIGIGVKAIIMAVLLVALWKLLGGLIGRRHDIAPSLNDGGTLREFHNNEHVQRVSRVVDGLSGGALATGVAAGAGAGAWIADRRETKRSISDEASRRTTQQQLAHAATTGGKRMGRGDVKKLQKTNEAIVANEMGMPQRRTGVGGRVTGAVIGAAGITAAAASGAAEGAQVTAKNVAASAVMGDRRRIDPATAAALGLGAGAAMAGRRRAATNPRAAAAAANTKVRGRQAEKRSTMAADANYRTQLANYLQERHEYAVWDAAGRPDTWNGAKVPAAWLAGGPIAPVAPVVSASGRISAGKAREAAALQANLDRVSTFDSRVGALDPDKQRPRAATAGGATVTPQGTYIETGVAGGAIGGYLAGRGHMDPNSRAAQGYRAAAYRPATPTTDPTATSTVVAGQAGVRGDRAARRARQAAPSVGAPIVAGAAAGAGVGVLASYRMNGSKLERTDTTVPMARARKAAPATAPTATGVVGAYRMNGSTLERTDTTVPMARARQAAPSAGAPVAAGAATGSGVGVLASYRMNGSALEHADTTVPMARARQAAPAVAPADAGNGTAVLGAYRMNGSALERTDTAVPMGRARQAAPSAGAPVAAGAAAGAGVGVLASRRDTAAADRNDTAGVRAQAAAPQVAPPATGQVAPAGRRYMPADAASQRAARPRVMGVDVSATPVGVGMALASGAASSTVGRTEQGARRVAETNASTAAAAATGTAVGVTAARVSNPVSATVVTGGRAAGVVRDHVAPPAAPARAAAPAPAPVPAARPSAGGVSDRQAAAVTPAVAPLPTEPNRIPAPAPARAAEPAPAPAPRSAAAPAPAPAARPSAGGVSDRQAAAVTPAVVPLPTEPNRIPTSAPARAAEPVALAATPAPAARPSAGGVSNRQTAAAPEPKRTSAPAPAARTAEPAPAPAPAPRASARPSAGGVSKRQVPAVSSTSEPTRPAATAPTVSVPQVAEPRHTVYGPVDQHTPAPTPFEVQRPKRGPWGRSLAAPAPAVDPTPEPRTVRTIQRRATEAAPTVTAQTVAAPATSRPSVRPRPAEPSAPQQRPLSAAEERRMVREAARKPRAERTDAEAALLRQRQAGRTRATRRVLDSAKQMVSRDGL